MLMLPEPLSGLSALLSPRSWAGPRPPEWAGGWRPWGRRQAGGRGEWGTVQEVRGWGRGAGLGEEPTGRGWRAAGDRGSARGDGRTQRGSLLCRELPFCRLGLASSEAQEPEVSVEMVGAAGPGPSADPPRLRAEPTLAGRPPPSSLPGPPVGGEASLCRASCSLGSPWSPWSQAHPEPRPTARNRPLGDQALAGRVEPRARTPREGRAHPRSHSGPRASCGGAARQPVGILGGQRPLSVSVINGVAF